MKKIADRINYPPELLETMYAHVGTCPHCDGVVKMWRDDETGKLLPEKCFCIHCYQAYYMNISDIAQWEAEQWEQKIAKL